MSSSKLSLSRPFLTQQEIKNYQFKTITDRKQYNAKKIMIFRYLEEIVIHFKFPRKTLEVTMYLYQRYYLFNKFDSAEVFDVAIACLYLGCKQVETMKKLSEIIPFCNGLKQEYLKSTINYDIETYKKKLTTIEFSILNSISFDSRIFDLSLSIDSLIVKFSKNISANEKTSYKAWIIGLDALKLEVLLSFPAHIVAFSCVKIAIEVAKDKQQSELQRLDELIDFLSLDKTTYSLCILQIVNFYINVFEDCELKKIFDDCDIKDFTTLQKKYIASDNSAKEEKNGTLKPEQSNEDEILEMRYVVNRRYYDGEEQLLAKKKQRL